jgi:hypothetical protein
LLSFRVLTLPPLPRTAFSFPCSFNLRVQGQLGPRPRLSALRRRRRRRQNAHPARASRTCFVQRSSMSRRARRRFLSRLGRWSSESLCAALHRHCAVTVLLIRLVSTFVHAATLCNAVLTRWNAARSPVRARARVCVCVCRRVIEKTDDSWWKAMSNGRTGMVPNAYLKPM